MDELLLAAGVGFVAGGIGAYLAVTTANWAWAFVVVGLGLGLIYIVGGSAPPGGPARTIEVVFVELGLPGLVGAAVGVAAGAWLGDRQRTDAAG